MDKGKQTTDSGMQPDGSDGAVDGGAPPAIDPGQPPARPAAAPPPGAADDSVRCGNGILDDDELCDVAIGDGEVGACPNACPSSDPCHPEMLHVQTCWSRYVPVPAPAGCL
jgi:hypothetical protein